MTVRGDRRERCDSRSGAGPAPAAAITGPVAAFDPALAGTPSHLVRDDGVEVVLAARRWRRSADGEDHWLLDRCTGPVIDVGCGPGRLVAALGERGVPALGVDVSSVAQRLCRRRRTPMVRRDVFGPLPGEGTWGQVLLADGNIGIGGDPLHLLRRAVQLLRPGGSVLVETDTEPDLLWRGTASIRTAAGTGTPLPWACAGTDALVRLGVTLGLRRAAHHRGPRSFVELRTSGTVSEPGAAAAG
jgi:SAM-dependent methyltransferase